jgi:adenine/guanine phosphoribosyltransferase-like PRPP-binding protein
MRGPGLDIRPETTELLGTLRDVLTLPCPASLDYALALDWTKQPVDGTEARLWPETRVGDLVRRGKYWYKDPQRVTALRQVGRALTAELCNLICRHVLLRTTDTILAVPGHDARVLSFGARLASSVANELNLSFAPLNSLSDFRTPAKNLDQSARYAVIGGQFRCDLNLEGQSVLVVDDLYGSGTTAGEAARAARAAGATQVAALCAVRTMKSS